MKKIIKNVACIIGCAMLLWVAASYLDIVWDNTSFNPVHSPYNFFILAFGG